MTSPSASPADQTGRRTAVFRRYLVIRIAWLIAAALAVAAVVLAFVLKESPVGLITSLGAFVALFIAFQILMRKRRTYFRRWVVLNEEP